MFKCALTAALTLLAGPLFAADFSGAYTWRWPTDDHRFGGLSGIEMGADGETFVAISDHGYILNGSVDRVDQKILSVKARIDPILTTQDTQVRGLNRDAEGIAVGRDGRVFISFEGNHRVASHHTDGSNTVLLPRHAEFDNLQHNSGLESLAISSDGSLFAMPERSGQKDLPFPLYKFSDGAWTVAARIPRRGSYLAVGMDFGPDGTLYLLERQLSVFGFRSRIRAFDLSSTSLNERVVLQTTPRQFDNLEGISVWSGADGITNVTLISDDNYKSFQRTQIVEYKLPKN